MPVKKISTMLTINAHYKRQCVHSFLTLKSLFTTKHGKRHLTADLRCFVLGQILYDCEKIHLGFLIFIT